MPRARNIKPGFYKNDKLAECSIWARYIFPGLWMLADKDGRLEDRPKMIKAELLPYDNPEITGLLQELHEHSMITRYTIGDTDYIQINTFLKHQNCHKNEKSLNFPPPEKGVVKQYITKESSNYSIDPVITGSIRPLTESLLLNKEKIEKKEKSEIDSKITRLPLTVDFELSTEWLQFATTERNVKVEIVQDWFASFKEYYLTEAKTKQGKKSDWFMTWKNWVRRERVPYDLKEKASSTPSEKQLQGETLYIQKLGMANWQRNAKNGIALSSEQQRLLIDWESKFGAVTWNNYSEYEQQQNRGKTCSNS